MDDVGNAWVLICWVMRSANLVDLLNLLLSMLEDGLPAGHCCGSEIDNGSLLHGLHELNQFRHKPVTSA